MPQPIQEQLAEVARQTPCTCVDDLYGVPAKRLLARIASDFLTENMLTATEFLHRPDMHEKFENDGTALQFAVQQIAVLRAPAEGKTVHEIVKSLHKLVDELVWRVRSDKRNGVFPAFKSDEAGALATRLAVSANGKYLFNGALAQNLRDVRNWNEKIVRVLELLDAPGQSEGARRLIADTADEIVADALRTQSALDDIIGPMQYFGESLLMLFKMFEGVEQAGQYGKDQAIARIARCFAAGMLTLSHAALGAELVAQIGALKRLRTDSVEDELKMLKQVTEHAKAGFGEDLHEEEVFAALVRRSARFTTQDTIRNATSRKTRPEDKLDWLLTASACIIGEANQQQLADAAIRVCSSGMFKTHFLTTNIPLSQRLQCLTRLNARVLDSNFADEDRLKLTGAFNAMAMEAAAQARMFEAIDARQSTSVEKASALLQLFAAGTFTEGAFSLKARQMVLRYTAQPGFLEIYAGNSLIPDSDVAKAEWLDRLKAAGIPPEAGLKALALSS